MAEMSDIELLGDYSQRGSEEAFAELVRRRINLVYSTALRHVGVIAQAEEITQAVFVILARKAAGLRPDTVLEAWLYETTRLTSLSFLRGERRRQLREQEAYMQSTLQESGDDSTWNQIRPLLDEAMARLGKKDREAVVLRFFQEKNLREVATAMKVTESAAQSRVHRALEKLRGYFSKCGVSSTTAIIANEISANSVHVAPIGLAKTVSAAALAKGAATSISTLTLVKGALKLMAWTKAKTAVVTGVVILLAVEVTTTATVKEIELHKKYPWQVPQASFGVFYKMPATVNIVPTKYSKDGGWCCDGSRGAMGIAQPLKNIIEVAWQQDNLHTVVEADLPSKRYDFFAKLVGPQGRHQNDVNTNWDTALQQEIIQEFGVKGDMQTRNADVLVLRPSSIGPKNFKVSRSMPHGMAVNPSPGNFSAYEQPIGTLRAMLQSRFKTPIVDETGLSEEYDYSLHWNQTGSDQPDLDSLKQALLDQLGLELVTTNMPVRMLVVVKAD